MCHQHQKDGAYQERLQLIFTLIRIYTHPITSVDGAARILRLYHQVDTSALYFLCLHEPLMMTDEYFLGMSTITKINAD